MYIVQSNGPKGLRNKRTWTYIGVRGQAHTFNTNNLYKFYCQNKIFSCCSCYFG